MQRLAAFLARASARACCGSPTGTSRWVMPWRAKMSPNSLSACTRPASSLRLDPDGGGGHPGAAPRRHPRPVRRQKRDRRQLAEVLARIDPCTTLFVVASKTGVEDGGQDKVGQRPARTMRLRWRRRRSFACPEIGRRQWRDLSTWCGPGWRCSPSAAPARRAGSSRWRSP